MASATPVADRALVEQAYERMHFMLRASHILLGLPENADATTVSLVMRSAQTLRRKVEDGEASFESIAVTYSDDPSVTVNSGDLGFFTVFEQPYAIENAAFMTRVGSVSNPVRSRYGIHLVLPTARVAIKGVKQVSHIMLAHGAGDRIRAIRREVNQDNFAQRAQQYSEDARTRNKGGDLGTDRLVDELEAVRLELGVGEISEPVRSASGWHLLMVTGFEPFPDLEEMRPALLERIRQSERARSFVE